MSSVLAKNTSNAENQSATSWAATLKCQFEFAGNRTIVRHEHCGPLRIQRPFYPENDVAHVYLLHPPGGVVGGDKLTISISSGAKAAGLLTTPGAAKFYRSNGQAAHVSQELNGDGGSIEWFPQENIFFPGCDVNIHADINLHKGASLAWWDINCFGLGDVDKSFSQGSVNSVVNLRVDNLLLLRERILVNEDFPLSLNSGLRGNTTVGTLVLRPVHPERISSVRQTLSDQPQFAVTTFDGLMIVRYLGNSTEQAKNGFIQVWSKLRSELNGKPVCLPRIWAT